MGEKTIVKTMELPFGRDWAWYADANLVALAPHLDESGRRQALCEASVHWRRSCLHILRERPLVTGAQPPTTLSQVAH